MSNNKQDHIGEANKMVSSVELLRCKMIALTLLKLNQSDRDMMEHFFNQAKAMHKDEIEDALLFGDVLSPTTAENYYKVKFGGNNEPA